MTHDAPGDDPAATPPTEQPEAQEPENTAAAPDNGPAEAAKEGPCCLRIPVPKKIFACPNPGTTDVNR